MHARCSRLAAVALIAALAAPAVADDVVVWIYDRAGEKVGFEKVVAAYNARKGAGAPHVKMVSFPFDGIADKIGGAIPRGKGPDVFLYPQDRLGGWVEAGGIIDPVDRFLDTALKDRFIPTTLQATTYRGVVQGLPVSYKLVTLIYNRKLVKAPPTTSGELAMVARKLTDRAAGKYGLVYPYSDYYYHAALQNGFGGRVFDPFMNPDLACRENVLAMLQLLRWKDEFLPEQEPAEGLVAELFNAGKAAMIIEGPWFLGDIKLIDYGFAQLPTLDEAGGQPMRPWMTVEGAYITAPSKQKEAAFDFIRYLTDQEAARVMALDGDRIPANQKVYTDAAVAHDEKLNAFFRQARVAVAMPNAPEMAKMWGPATSAIGSIARRAATPEEALTKAQAAMLKSIGGPRKTP